jgi:hypothetical protein
MNAPTDLYNRLPGSVQRWCYFLKPLLTVILESIWLQGYAARVGEEAQEVRTMQMPHELVPSWKLREESRR